MGMEKKKTITVNLSEDKTIVDLSQLIHKYNSEIFLKKNVNGSIVEVNLKSFLGLITLQLHNSDRIEVRALGNDADEAIEEVENFFS